MNPLNFHMEIASTCRLCTSTVLMIKGHAGRPEQMAQIRGGFPFGLRTHRNSR